MSLLLRSGSRVHVCTCRVQVSLTGRTNSGPHRRWSNGLRQHIFSFTIGSCKLIGKPHSLHQVAATISSRQMEGGTWYPVPAGSHFSLANLPFGIITTEGSDARHVAVAIGDYAVDLAVFASFDGFSGLPCIKEHLDVFSQPVLNNFAALGHVCHREVRHYLRQIFTEGTELCRRFQDDPIALRGIVPLKQIQTHLPFKVGDYTDFYVGKYHALNAGKIVLGRDNALPPSYMYQPIGYHSRASSVVVSGTPIRRPNGQILEDHTSENPKPVFTASRRLDFELELGAFICKANRMGESIGVGVAEEHIFGFVILNDWSARDIQKWEMAPLGPFNSKNFGTSVSAWVVTADALEPFKTQGIENEFGHLPYLQEKGVRNVYNLHLEVDLKSKYSVPPIHEQSSPTTDSWIAESGVTTTISRTNGKNLLFSFPQMIAHHTAGGCPLQVGDLIGSGTGE